MSGLWSKRPVSQRDELCAASTLDVSRETLERLDTYSRALAKWSPAINLIGKATLADLWSRHILDSAQLWRFMPQGARSHCDLGAGGGLPGIVLACLGAQASPDLAFTLIESDARKAVFLKMIADELGLRLQVLRGRAEEVPPAGADSASARALAPLPLLLDYCHRHLSEGGVALLPKGRTHQQEVDAARHSWHFDCQVEPSFSDPESAILVVRNLHPVEQTR